VKQCSFLSGTASLPQGATLILAMRNLINGDPTRYVEYVFGWDDPTPRPTWRGAQYFGTADDTVGQRFAVELIAIERSAAQAAQDAGQDDGFNALPQVGVLLDQVELHRVAGEGPNHCEGP
jgi:serine/threonine-protein kinase